MRIDDLLIRIVGVCIARYSLARATSRTLKCCTLLVDHVRTNLLTPYRLGI